VSPSGSIIIGLLAGTFCCLATAIKFKFRFDDSLDVVAVHLVGGLLGSLLLGFFATIKVNPAGADGVFFGGGVSLLVDQLVAVGATLGYSFVVSLGLAKLIDSAIGLRVNPDEEAEGLDLSQHSETGYSLAELGSMGRIG
jgi:ammonium transporter, Amt family